MDEDIELIEVKPRKGRGQGKKTLEEEAARALRDAPNEVPTVQRSPAAPSVASLHYWSIRVFWLGGPTHEARCTSQACGSSVASCSGRPIPRVPPLRRVSRSGILPDRPAHVGSRALRSRHHGHLRRRRRMDCTPERGRRARARIVFLLAVPRLQATSALRSYYAPLFGRCPAVSRVQ